MNRYAGKTNVSVDKSKGELEWLLKRFGASQFAYMTSPTKSQIGFIIQGRRIEMTLVLPNPKEFERTETGRQRRNQADVLKCHEQACRSSWRELVLMIKAKLVGIQAKIATIDNEFLAYTALPNGQTIGDVLKPQVSAMITGGKVPQLLKGGEG